MVPLIWNPVSLKSSIIHILAKTVNTCWTWCLFVTVLLSHIRLTSLVQSGNCIWVNWKGNFRGGGVCYQLVALVKDTFYLLGEGGYSQETESLKLVLHLVLITWTEEKQQYAWLWMSSRFQKLIIHHKPVFIGFLVTFNRLGKFSSQHKVTVFVFLCWPWPDTAALWSSYWVHSN